MLNSSTSRRDVPPVGISVPKSFWDCRVSFHALRVPAIPEIISALSGRFCKSSHKVDVFPIKRPAYSELTCSRSHISWRAATNDIDVLRAGSKKLVKSSWAKSANSSMITEKCFLLSFGTLVSTLAETYLRSWRINLPMVFAVSEYLFVSRNIKMTFPVSNFFKKIDARVSCINQITEVRRAISTSRSGLNSARPSIDPDHITDPVPVGFGYGRCFCCGVTSDFSIK